MNKKPIPTTDGWDNVMTQVNVANKDKKTAARSVWQPIGQAKCLKMFAGDMMAKKIATIIPFDGTREGVTFKIDGKDVDAESAADTIKAINKEHKRLDTWQKISWAWAQARAQGGAVIYMAIDDSKELHEPVDLSAIRKVTALQVWDRWDFSVDSTLIITDINDPDFGLPEFYRYTGDMITLGESGSSFLKIHKSRVLRFDGEDLPRNLFKSNNYWGDSIYNSTGEQIRDYSITHSTIATILTEINQPIFKIHGLHDAMVQGKDNYVSKRLNIIAAMRSSLRAMAIDKDDEFGHVATALAGVKDLVDLTKENLTAVSTIPHTRLLGESPGAALGEQGKSQLIDYYDHVACLQEIKVRKPFQSLTDILFNQMDVDIDTPESFSFEFNPLYQQSQKEIIETRKMQAEIDEIYMTRGVYSAFEVAESRFETGEYSFETSLQDNPGEMHRVSATPEEIALLGEPKAEK
jgi:hypothetical protein